MRRAIIEEQRKVNGRPALAVLPIHHPKEILTAMGVLAVELWGPPGAPRSAHAGRLQTYVCAVARNALAFLESDGAEAVDGVLVPHTCDALQGLGSLLTDLGVKARPCLTFTHPRGADRPSLRRFLRAELQALATRLEVLGVPPLAPERLAWAVSLHQVIDDLRGQLLDRRACFPGDDAELYAVLRRGEYLWPEDHLAELRRAAARLRPEPVQRLAPVLVTGIVPEPAALLPFLATAGMYVAADDWAAVGRRVARRSPPRAADPWDDVVERYLALPPCSTRTADTASRVAHLVGLATRSGARGVILHSMKFCEPELFDLPAIRRAFAERGLPVLELETELEAELPGQAVTRLEAFGEMLADQRRPA